MSTLRTTTAWSLAGLTAAAATAVLGLGASGSAADPAARDDAGLTSVRNATEQFQDVNVALAHGYRPASPCQALPGAGAMGVHYVHPGLAADGQVIATRPDVLLYEPSPAGPVLVGVEYFIAEDAVNGQHPRVLGRPLDGPMPGHHAGMPRHYDLHVWAWRDNPNGVTAQWNPAVSC